VSAGFTIDASKVTRGIAKLAKGLEDASAKRGMEHATRTAKEIQSAVPVLTGRLAGTVKATRTQGGGDVHYGGTLPYARKIERRNHAVANALAGAPSSFHRTMVAAAEQEVAKL
jgi:hypothetical protein